MPGEVSWPVKYQGHRIEDMQLACTGAYYCNDRFFIEALACGRTMNRAGTQPRFFVLLTVLASNSNILSAFWSYLILQHVCGVSICAWVVLRSEHNVST